MSGNRNQNGGAPSASATSPSLLEGVKAKDEEAWQRLSELYGPLIYHWCRNAGLRAEDAADIVQDVFRSVLANVHRFCKDREGDTFRGWLWTITRNRIRDLYRVRRHRPEAMGGTDAQRQLADVSAQEEHSELDSVTAGSSSQLLHRALDAIRGEFQKRTWRAFFLTVMQGRTSNEAAQEVSITANAVRSGKARVLRRLRQELGDLDD